MSIKPMAARVVPADIQQIHHFVSTPFWARSSFGARVGQAGPDAVLVIDDTALVKQGWHSVRVKCPYGGDLGK